MDEAGGFAAEEGRDFGLAGLGAEDQVIYCRVRHALVTGGD